MKEKLFIIFNAIRLLMTGASSKLINCQMIKHDDVNYSNSNLQNDMLTWMKIASQVSNEITNYDNNGNTKD